MDILKEIQSINWWNVIEKATYIVTLQYLKIDIQFYQLYSKSFSNTDTYNSYKFCLFNSSPLLNASINFISGTILIGLNSLVLISYLY